MAKFGVISTLAALVLAASALAASQAVTLTADRPVAAFASGSGAVTLTGRLSNGRAGEAVEIEAKECGSSDWRLVATDKTAGGGSFHASSAPAITTTYRARWRDEVSAPVEVLVRPAVRLDQRSRTKFTVSTIALRFFRGARGRFERFDRARGSWVLVRTVRLDRGSAPRGVGWAYSDATFTARVPVRSLVRFVLPREQTGPCYLAGLSIQFNVR